MQEHPVPQNVTGYEFHLIGQMTLKQFMEVAGGILVAVLINLTNLPGFIKYPLMIIAGLLGAAMAFIPLGGRPLDRWFFAFIKSIYQPTMFFWKKSEVIPDAFKYVQPANIDTAAKIDYTPIRQSRVQEYIHTVSAAPAQGAPDDPEAAAAANILALFSDSSLPKIASPTPTVTQPPANVTTPAPQTVVYASAPTPPPATDTMGHILEMEVESASAPLPPPTTPSSTLPELGGVIMDNSVIGYAQKSGVTAAHLPASPPPPTATPAVSPDFGTISSPTPQAATAAGLTPAPTLTSLPFPNRPTTPNMIAGMVTTPDEKIIENAIVTITRQSDNTPVRAMKTNTLGQFAIVTPLDSATYIISVEKDGYRFDNHSLVLNNQVVEPLLLKAL